MDNLKILKNKLFPYAYNFLENISDSQDVPIKFNEKETGSISNQNAYLIKSAINKAINLKKKNNRLRTQRISTV